MNRLTIPSRHHRIELFDRPGRWMPAARLHALSERLIAILRDRLGEDIHDGFYRGRERMSEKLILVASTRRTGEDEACVAMAWVGTHGGRPILHSGLAVSKREARGVVQRLYAVGLGWALLRHGIHRRIWVTSITHTPRIFGSVAAYYRDVFPALDPEAQPAPWQRALRDQLLREYVQRQRGTDAPPAVRDDFVLPGFRAQADGGLWIPDTWETVPKHRDPAYNERLRGMLDLERGDDVVQVGWMSFAAVLRSSWRAGLLRKG
jgi:hypothetical protein